MGLLSGALDLDDFPAGITAARGTGAMRHLRAMALRTSVQRRRRHAEMAAPLVPARLGYFSFR